MAISLIHTHQCLKSHILILMARLNQLSLPSGPHGHTKSSENGVFGIYASWLDSSCSMHVDSVIVLVSSGGNL